MKALDLHGIERKSWRMLQRDGLTDALFGVIFLAGAVVGILDRVDVPDWTRIATLSAIQLSGVITMLLLRKRIVAPRLGRVKYSPRRMSQTRTARLLARNEKSHLSKDKSNGG